VGYVRAGKVWGAVRGRVHGRALEVLLQIAYKTRHDETVCSVSATDVATALGMAEEHVRAARSQLVALGMLERITSGGGRGVSGQGVSSSFRFCLPSGQPDGKESGQPDSLPSGRKMPTVRPAVR
jgi:hypothetical protein